MFGPIELDDKLRAYVGPNFPKLTKEGVLNPINGNHEYFINSSVLTDDIQKRLISKVLIENVRGKLNIKKYQRVRNIKKDETLKRDEGGNPSAYFVTSELEHVSDVLQKVKALNYLQERILESGLYDKLGKYYMSTFCWVARLDPNVFQRSMNSATVQRENEQLNAQEKNTFDSICRLIQAMDEKEFNLRLRKISNQQSKSNSIDEGYLKHLAVYYSIETSDLIGF
jgi:hypothetical protein